jgi:hypothetical protein
MEFRWSITQSFSALTLYIYDHLVYYLWYLRYTQAINVREGGVERQIDKM